MKIVKSVSFNAKNPDEAEMIKMFKRRSFSKYVKKLIRDDIKRQKEMEQPKQLKKPNSTNQTLPKVFRGGIKIKIKE